MPDRQGKPDWVEQADEAVEDETVLRIATDESPTRPAKQRDQLQKFSNEAAATFLDLLSQYASDLERESRIIAARSDADIVSRSHVTKAGQFIAIGSTSRRSRALGNIGGVFLGGTLGGLVAMLLQSTYPGPAVVTTVILGVVGGFLIAYDWIKD